MKKLLVLTSVLAVAACGGGGGDGAPTPATRPTRSAITNDSAAALSNAHITSMVSEVLVGQDGTVVTPSLNRRGTAQYNGQIWTSYRLDDVTFRIGGEDSIIKFKVNQDGRIISAGKYDRNGDKYDKISKEGVFTRAADDSAEFGGAKTLYVWTQNLATVQADLVDAIAEAIDGADLPDGVSANSLATDIASHFSEPVEVENDSDDINVKNAMEDEIAGEVNDWMGSQPYSGDWLQAVATAAISYYQGLLPSSFGNPKEYAATLNVRGANVNLKYADLGFAEIQVADKNNASDVTEHVFATYVGGYDDLERNVDETMEFTGTALASVEHTKTDGKKESVLVRQDNAVFTVNTNGSSSLVMNNLNQVENDGVSQVSGKHWYSMTVNKDATGLPTFIVGETAQNNISGYNLIHNPSGDTVAFLANQCQNGQCAYSDTDNHVHHGGSVENHIFGPSATDIEATSKFGFSDEDTETHEEIAIYGAFGGAPTTPTEP